MEKADGLMYYRKFAEAMFRDSSEWTIETVADYLQKEVGIQKEKCIQAATEAKANVDKEKATA
mgnify:CR=1 FL=1